jgi:hypothetical protein
LDSGEDCSGGVLEPRWSNLLSGKPGFHMWSAVMRFLSGTFFSSEEYRAKVHPDGRHFYKVLFENDLKIKNKPTPENFKLQIYTRKLSAGLPNLVILSL